MDYAEVSIFPVSSNISATLCVISIIFLIFSEKDTIKERRKRGATVTSVNNDIVSGKTRVYLNQTPIALSWRNSSYGCPVRKGEQSCRARIPRASKTLGTSHCLKLVSWADSEALIQCRAWNQNPSDN